MFETGLLFPPDEPSKPESPTPKPGPTAAPPQSLGILTVQQLTQMVRSALSARLPSELHVAGQISNLATPAGGHLYFTLKDAASELRCVMWRSDAARLKFRPSDGLEVVATGNVDVFEPRGQYQLYVRRLEPRGVGALELAFRQLKEKLSREGLFDPARKRRLPRFPRTIAVVTSPTGAALRDIVQTLGRRWPLARVIVVGVRVQGEGAAAEIADAIRRINLSKRTAAAGGQTAEPSAAAGGSAREDTLAGVMPRASARGSDERTAGAVDVLIVGRGGGSIEDLWAFNEEVVARAIHASRIPIISAVGHEVDFTIADFVADLRAATPTAAAELVAPARDEVIAGFEAWGVRLDRCVRSALELAVSRLATLERSPVMREPLGLVQRRGERLDDLAGRLDRAIRARLGRLASLLHEVEVRLTRVRPEAVLAARRERLARMEHRLRWAQGHFNLVKERRLSEWASRLATATPMRRIQSAWILSQQLEGRLDRGVRIMHDYTDRKLEALQARLVAASHESVLARGFSILRKASTGAIVTAPNEVSAGDALETQTAGGIIQSVAESG